MGSTGRGIGYVLLAAVIAGGGYLLGKYRYLKGKTTYTTIGTMIGLAVLIYTPKSCDVVKKALEVHGDITKCRITSEGRRDSLEATISINSKKDTTEKNLENISTKILQMGEQLSSKYDTFVQNSIQQYKETISNTNKNYKEIIQNIQKNEITLDTINNNLNNTNTAKYQTRKLEQNITKYIIEADKSDRIITVYELQRDGSRSPITISSRASFAKTGGPNNGQYVLENKGSRTGELYPGFISIDGNVGISGAGENNEFLTEINRGDLANKSGIRVPNNIYTKIASIVSTNNTTMIVHE